MSKKINVLQIGLGFIGGRYKEILDERIDKFIVKKLENDLPLKVETPSNKSITLAKLSNQIQAIVVFAYSDRRKENFEILQNVFSLAKKLGIKTIIYIGTSAIFKIKDGLTDEHSPHLVYRDHYADTKLKIRSLLKKKAHSFHGSIIVLHPTIVFGKGGNWTRTIRNSLKFGKVLLPKEGSGTCNPIHVDDVCEAIDLAINRSYEAKFSEYIISSGVTTAWRNIYERARTIAIKENIKTGHIANCKQARLFHSSWIRNIVYHFLYSPLGIMLIRIIKLAKEKESITSKKDRLDEFQSSNTYQPTGIYRLLHIKKQIFSIKLAKDELNFNPKFSSEDEILESFAD